VRRIAAIAALAIGLALALACDEPEIVIPVRSAPASRHDSLRDALRDDARAFAFEDGDWLEDLEDAPNYGLAWLARTGEDNARRDAAKTRALERLEGEPYRLEKLESARGLVEYAVAAGDRSVVPALEAYADRLAGVSDYFAVATYGDEAEYGPTALTAMVALLDAEMTLFLGSQRKGHALAIDAAIRARAYGDLIEPTTLKQARAYAFAPGMAGIRDAPNLAMLILKARLFRLTKDEVLRIEARALNGVLESVPLALLSSRADRAFGLTLMFEITGEQRFIDATDAAFDSAAALRGPWCSPVTTRCTTGLVHDQTNGALASTLCAGCTFRMLWTLGYRRALAGAAY